MSKLLRVFLAGLVVTVPFAITVWVIVSLALWVNSLGLAMLGLLKVEVDPQKMGPWLGAAIVVAAVFLVGLLTRLWVFRWMLAGVERLLGGVPGVRTIYESVRDLIRLFGQDSRRMGRVVLYEPPGAPMGMLGILTTETPAGLTEPQDRDKVAVYLPMAYMLGGPVIYVSRGHIREVDLPVEQAIKLSATAQVGYRRPETPQDAPPAPPGSPARGDVST